MGNKAKVYMAGPLFSKAERAFNESLVSKLRELLPGMELILPQDFANKIAGQNDFIEAVFRYCLDSIRDADAVVGILDGADVDSGTCVELGYAYALGKPIIGLRTDFRNLESGGVNLMVSGVCTKMIWFKNSIAEIETIAIEVGSAVGHLLKFEGVY